MFHKLWGRTVSSDLTYAKHLTDLIMTCATTGGVPGPFVVGLTEGIRCNQAFIEGCDMSVLQGGIHYGWWNLTTAFWQFGCRYRTIFRHSFRDFNRYDYRVEIAVPAYPPGRSCTLAASLVEEENDVLSIYVTRTVGPSLSEINEFGTTFTPTLSLSTSDVCLVGGGVDSELRVPIGSCKKVSGITVEPIVSRIIATSVPEQDINKNLHPSCLHAIIQPICEKWNHTYPNPADSDEPATILPSPNGILSVEEGVDLYETILRHTRKDLAFAFDVPVIDAHGVQIDRVWINAQTANSTSTWTIDEVVISGTGYVTPSIRRTVLFMTMPSDIKNTSTATPTTWTFVFDGTVVETINTTHTVGPAATACVAGTQSFTTPCLEYTTCSRKGVQLSIVDILSPAINDGTPCDIHVHKHACTANTSDTCHPVVPPISPTSKGVRLASSINDLPSIIILSIAALIILVFSILACICLRRHKKPSSTTRRKIPFRPPQQKTLYREKSYNRIPDDMVGISKHQKVH